MGLGQIVGQSLEITGCMEGTPMTDLTFAHFSEVNRSRCERWHPGFPEPGPSGWSGADWSNAMAGEAGETCNVVKKIRRADVNLVGPLDPDRTKLLDDLANEIADTLCYLDLLATYYGIDLALAVARKFNAVSALQGFPEQLP